MISISVLDGRVYEVKLFYDPELDRTIVELVHFYPGEIQREKMIEEDLYAELVNNASYA